MGVGFGHHMLYVGGNRSFRNMKTGSDISSMVTFMQQYNNLSFPSGELETDAVLRKQFWPYAIRGNFQKLTNRIPVLPNRFKNEHSGHAEKAKIGKKRLGHLAKAKIGNRCHGCPGHNRDVDSNLLNIVVFFSVFFIGNPDRPKNCP